MESVSWEYIQEFIQKLNHLSGKRYRLPTEAEWEYACRAETTGDRYGILNEIAWYRDNSNGSKQPVGLKKQNAFGLFDMLGNLIEWVNDWYSRDYYERAPINDPPGPDRPDQGLWIGRVWRGAHYNDPAVYVTAGHRRTWNMADAWAGFRLAMDD